MGHHTSVLKTDEPPVPPDGVQPVLDAIRRIVQALRESSRQAETDTGLSGAQLFVMQVLAQQPALSINEVAEKTHTHQSSVSVVVQRLVERRFVRRERSPEDARRSVLSLTATGLARLVKTPDLAQARLIQAVAGLPAERRRELASLLTEVVDGMALDQAPPTMFFEDATTNPRDPTDG